MSDTFSRQHGGSRSTGGQPTIPEPSYAERARTLIYLGRIGSLSTLSQKNPGWPFGSMMPYVLDERGRPILLISTMAMHTKNIIRDPRASLFVTQNYSATDPLDNSRVTLMGKVLKVQNKEAEDVKNLYLSRHENARYWVDFDDFSFFRMDIIDVYFVGGFGAMGWITAEEYNAAEVDPLAEFAPGIIQHMNEDHADALLLLAKAFGNVEADDAKMTSVDRLGFQARLKSGDRIHSIRIPFIREARSRQETRTVLVEMVEQARKEVNM